MTSSPLVSIILTSYNHEKFIGKAIESILNQTFVNFELIILDDCSSDNSWEIINSYSDSRIKKYRNLVNQGSTSGVNRAISRVAKGEYIAMHHSDDVWEPEKLRKQCDYLAANKKVGAIFSNASIIDENSRDIEDISHPYFNVFTQQNKSRFEWLRQFFILGNALCHPSALVRKSVYKECGIYQPEYSQLPDFDMWIRVCKKFDIYVLAEKLVKFRILDNYKNTSADSPEVRIRTQFEYYKILERFRNVRSYDDFVRIFPETTKYCTKHNFDVDYALSMICFELKPFNFTLLFAQNILIEKMSNSKKAQILSESFNFDLKDFVKITGKYDVFSINLERRLNNEIQKLTTHNVFLNSELKKLKRSFFIRVFIFIGSFFKKLPFRGRFKI
jgi:glycosyltransferase involved in cell wall biosynthesis